MADDADANVARKLCSYCSAFLPLDDFNFSAKGSQQRQGYCRACQAHYKDNKRLEHNVEQHRAIIRRQGDCKACKQALTCRGVVYDGPVAAYDKTVRLTDASSRAWVVGHGEEMEYHFHEVCERCTDVLRVLDSVSAEVIAQITKYAEKYPSPGRKKDEDATDNSPETDTDESNEDPHAGAGSI